MQNVDLVMDIRAVLCGEQPAGARLHYHALHVCGGRS
jgi:hypothetical protein